MAHLCYNDLRKVVELAQEEVNRLAGRDEHQWAQSAVDDVKRILKAMEEYSYKDHRDLWEQVDLDKDNSAINPLRIEMTVAARKYKEAEQKLHKDQNNAVHPKAVYSSKAHSVNSDDVWNKIPKVDGIETGMVIIETLINRTELDADMHYWGSGTAHEDNHRSVIYFLKHLRGTESYLVCHYGGGWMLLEEDLVVGLESWMKVRDSKRPIPKSWLRA